VPFDGFCQSMKDVGVDSQLLERVRALRATGRSPKQIARALGLRPAQVTPLVRLVAAEDRAALPSPSWSAAG
jgi:hypothetical protein